MTDNKKSPREEREEIISKNPDESGIPNVNPGVPPSRPGEIPPERTPNNPGQTPPDRAPPRKNPPYE